MPPFNTVIAGLILANIAIRLGGFYIGTALPQTGPWARGLKALPGTLITALVTLQLMQGGANEWIAAATALATAVVTRSLPLTMIASILTVYALRNWA